jgi:polyvinyl alcohol dehydrogenase (cytochrome)
MRNLLFILCAASVLVTSAVAADAGHCTGAAKPFNPGAGDWIGWGNDDVNSRYQPTPGLAAADVPKLKLKWSFGFPPADVRTVAQPVIVGGRVFVGTYSGTVYSLDAATGCLYWIYEAGAVVRNGISIVKPEGSQKWMAFFGDGGGTAHALDAQTGQELWKVKVDDHPLARLTGSPVYYKGRLYIPAASGEELGSGQPKYECCKFRGSLSALDAATGKVIWKTFTVPDPAKPYKKTADGVQLYGPAGAGIWSSPTIDEKRKRIYAGTGNSYTGIDIHTSDAIVAFDLDTGALIWSNQVTPGDNWIPGCPRAATCPENPGDDYDFGGSTVLRTVNGKDILLAAQKSGFVYGLDPDNRGAILWKTQIGKGTGLMGGIAWGIGADARTVYAAVADINRPDGTPGLYALNIATGEKIWNTPAPIGAGNPAQASAVSVMPGIVFSASFGGRLRAYESKAGAIVWEYDAKHDYETVNGVPAKGGSFNGAGPAISHGMVITANGYGFAGGAPGNVLLAFSVDGK